MLRNICEVCPYWRNRLDGDEAEIGAVRTAINNIVEELVDAAQRLVCCHGYCSLSINLSRFCRLSQPATEQY